MTAAELADLNGMVSCEVTARAIHDHDTRDKAAIVDDILRDVEAPSLARTIHSLMRMAAWRASRIGRSVC